MVKAGDQVKKGDAVAVMEAMKMEVWALVRIVAVFLTTFGFSRAFPLHLRSPPPFPAGPARTHGR